jgi:glycerophosphoryl diester phosphodiesterase
VCIVDHWRSQWRIVADPPMLAIAHRFGNQVADVRLALDAGVDLVEADVHYYRRELEVRHLKTLGPHLLWDKGQVVRREGLTLPDLATVLTALDGDSRIMLDLKGRRADLAPQVAELLRGLAPASPVTVCAKRWWMLDAFAPDPQIRVVLSAGTRPGLLRLRRRLRARPGSAFGVSVRRSLLTPEVVRELHRRVDRVLAWPVDTRSDLDHARHLGVSGVISKNLRLLAELVASR